MNQTPVTTATVEQAIETTYRKSTLTKTGVVALALLAPAITGTAADSATATAKSPAPAPQLTKPDWLSDLSVSVREFYDDNVFAAGAGPGNQLWPATYKVPTGSVAALKGESSFVTSVSPKIGINFVPLLGDQKTVQSLSLAYNPEFVTFHQTSSESFNVHRIIGGLKFKEDAFSGSLDNTFSLIDGNKLGAVFPGGLNSAYATAILRERRDQNQDRSGVLLQYDLDHWFIRPTASLINYDLQTEQLPTSGANGFPGYQNYVDRHDVNGGADIGYKITPKLAATIGYRYGNQYQQTYARNIDPAQLSSSSDYQRALIGFEGKPLSWLDFKLQGGPDFRSYGNRAPVNDRDYTTYYGEAAVTATITPNDAIAFKYKQYQWVSSTGKVPYFDSSFDLTYRRKLVTGLFLELGAKFQESDYTSGLTNLKSRGGTTNLRDDSLTSLTAGITYAFNQNFSANIAYNAFLGRNLQDKLPARTEASSREFNDNIASVGATFKF